MSRSEYPLRRPQARITSKHKAWQGDFEFSSSRRPKAEEPVPAEGEVPDAESLSQH